MNESEFIDRALGYLEICGMQPKKIGEEYIVFLPTQLKDYPELTTRAIIPWKPEVLAMGVVEVHMATTFFGTAVPLSLDMLKFFNSMNDGRDMPCFWSLVEIEGDWIPNCNLSCLVKPDDFEPKLLAMTSYLAPRALNLIRQLDLYS